MKLKLFFLLSIVLIISTSCLSPRKTNYEDKLKDAVKQYAYCNCLKKATKEFSVIDSSEGSLGASIESIDYYSYKSGISFSCKKNYKIIDSLIKDVIVKEKLNRDVNNGKYESVIGKTFYFSNCLDLYKSKQLDSIINDIIREDKILSKK